LLSQNGVLNKGKLYSGNLQGGQEKERLEPRRRGKRGEDLTGATVIKAGVKRKKN